jgi:bifunctional ADP-heptose synthase (sugar kinase/adenylyltransferase)
MNEPNTQPQKQFNILLIGDSCIDEYRYGIVERLSPEAPVPIFKEENTESLPGMVMNVHANLLKLGCNIKIFHGKPSVKTRLIDKRSKQQMIRIDKDVETQPFDVKHIDNIEQYDAIVISDYDKGFVTYETIEYLRQKFTGPMFLDTKKRDIAAFHGIHVKINETEYNNRWSINDKLVVTLGEKGAMYKTMRDPKGEVHFTAEKVEVVDVTGAGDTFLAALTFKYLKTQSIEQAVKFAIKASSITVQHMGCYAPTLEEICA